MSEPPPTGRTVHPADTTRAAEQPPPGQPTGRGAAAATPVGRRVVIGMAGLGLAGIVGGATVQRWVGAALRPVTSVGGTGLSDLLPGEDRFRLYTVVASDPRIAPDQVRLDVGGLVERPMTLGLAQLQAMPRTTLIKDFQCVTGWRVPRVRWDGVGLAALLDAAGVQAGARAVTFVSSDGAYTESLTLDQARRPDVMVAYGFQGGPVPAEHGGPVRLYVAPMYGYKSCKWLSAVRVVDRVEPGYWEQRGYDVDAWVGRSNGRDDAPVA